MIIKVKTLVFCENFMSTETFTLCDYLIAFLQPRCVGIHHSQITAMCFLMDVIIDNNIKSNPAIMDTLLHAIVAFSDAR